MIKEKEGEGKGVDEQTINSLSPHPVVSPPAHLQPETIPQGGAQVGIQL